LRISWAAVIEKALLQLMDARTFVRNHDGIKTGYTKDVLFYGKKPKSGEPPRWVRFHD